MGLATQQSNLNDYTDIMGYKNINISRDVDQSYMLKGGSTNRHSSGNQNNTTTGYSQLTIEKQSSTGSNQDSQILNQDTSSI